MAKCPKCAGDSFEMESVSVRNAPSDLFAIKCSHCETVITMFPPYWNPSTGNVLGQMDYVMELFTKKKK